MKTATYFTRGFIVGSTLIVVILVSQICLLFMGLLIMLGLHPFIVIGAFLLSIYFGLKSVTGEVLYTLDQDGLTKDVTPFFFKNLWGKKTFQFYPWEQIKDFKTGTDMSRSYEEFDFITINTTKGNKLEINTKKGDRSAFKEFEDVFRQYVKEASEGKLIDRNRPVSQLLMDEKTAMGSEVQRPTIKHVIKEKPSFYDTIWAKVLTFFFAIMTIGLITALITIGGGSYNSFFRLLFIIIPGLAYMYWRVFGKGNKK